MEVLTEAQPKVVDPDTASDDYQDIEDSATDEQELEQEIAVAANEEALLTQMDDALKRIEDGTYGICAVCGQPIAEKRLLAIPWASLCVQDEERLEQQNLSREELHTHDRDTHYA
jgi:RNA polymerase-binding protein DksA